MIVLGRVTAPFGIRGWVHIHPFGDDPAQWCEIGKWWHSREPDGANWTECSLSELKPHADGWIAKLAGVDSRGAAEAVVGDYLAAEREALPATAPDEYYWADLVGLSVRNQDGVGLGKVDSLIETVSNTVLVVKDGEIKRLLPFVDHVVRQVDLGAKLVLVDWGADW